MYLNLGDLGATIKQYVDEYQTKTKSNMNIESIADMKRFVEEYPEFRKLSGNVSKHVALVSELSRRVSQDHLLEISELEQGLACNENHNSDLKSIQRLIENPNINEDAKIRLVLLYALRYERLQNNAIKSLIDLLDRVGVNERKSAVSGFVKPIGSFINDDDGRLYRVSCIMLVTNKDRMTCFLINPFCLEERAH
jgi:vacuolar protein sorting-associated protein 45